MSEEREVLKHETDTPLANVPVRRVVTIENEPAAVRLLKPGDDAEERRLSAA
jgi:hypothetical protein